MPYYILAALTLAQHGIRVFMHGAEHHTAGRLYTSDALAAMGVPTCTSMDDAARRLDAHKFAFMPLQAMAPKLHAIMELRSLLGLRSPLHTVGRVLNPVDAPFSISAVTHSPYLDVHCLAAQIMGQKMLATFKGEGGEVERRPEKPCDVVFLRDNQPGRDEWPARVAGIRSKDEVMDPAILKALWSGETVDDIADSTIIATVAIALRYSNRADGMEDAEAKALSMWKERDRSRVPGI